MRDIVIFGSGQVAEVIYYYLKHEGKRNVVAFTVNQEYLSNDTVLGVPVVAFESILETHSPETHEIFVAISFKSVNKIREQKFDEVRAKGYTLASHVSPNATVWPEFKVQPNTIIMENNVIQPYVSIGSDVIMWSGNHIGHHTTIGDHCFIASHVVVSGSTTIGDNTFIGVNATIRDNVTIGKYNVIGAGTLVLADTPDKSVLIGQGTPISKVPSDRLRSI